MRSCDFFLKSIDKIKKACYHDGIKRNRAMSVMLTVKAALFQNDNKICMMRAL